MRNEPEPESARLLEASMGRALTTVGNPSARRKRHLWQMTRAELEAALEARGEVEHTGGTYRRLGPPDPPRGERTARVDFAEPDLQDSAGPGGVNERTILADYGDGAPHLDVYQAHVPSELVPRAQLVEREDAREAHEACRQRQRELGYPDPGEEGYEDCDEDFPRDADSYDWESLGSARSTPPAKLLVRTSGDVVIMDGNHRVELWGERGLSTYPAWVLDAKGHRAAILGALKAGERVPPRVLLDYPDLARIASYAPRKRPKEVRENGRRKSAVERPPFLASAEAGVRWLRGIPAAYVPTDEDELESLKESIRHFLKAVKPFFDKGSATLYRAILLPEDAPWRDHLQTNRMGLSWAFEREAAAVYFTEHEGDLNSSDSLEGTVVEAVVDAACVNWETSLIHTCLYDEEREVRLLPEQPVLLTAVDSERLSPPIAGNTGLVTERWRGRR